MRAPYIGDFYVDSIAVCILFYLCHVQCTFSKVLSDLSGWMKCWVIFSLLALLEVCVTHRVRGKLAESVKVLVLAWCLAPAPYSGSDLLFSVLAPLHWAVTSLATSAAPCLSCLMELSSEYILQPASYGAALVEAKSFQLLTFLSAEIPGEIDLFSF